MKDVENNQYQRVCRLCLNAATGHYKLNNTEAETFEKFLPEIVSNILIDKNNFNNNYENAVCKGYKNRNYL